MRLLRCEARFFVCYFRKEELMLMCFKRKKEKREWVYVLDGCQVRVVFAPKAIRQARRFARSAGLPKRLRA
ncbi:MAG: hypothetical protein FWC27_08405 [Firmicutes bacterium]|nr:hypothetical protein [Bacillota bacterium]